MYRRLALLNTLILVAAIILCVAFTGHSQSVGGIGAASVNIITSAAAGGGNKAPTARRGSSTVAYNTQYYYLVIQSDGSMDYEIITKRDEQAMFTAMREAYKAELARYDELKKEWQAAFGRNKPFPIDSPKQPQLQQKDNLSTSDKYRAVAEARHEAELEQYAVCVLTNEDGTRTVEVIRRDKVAARRNELNKQFVNDALSKVVKDELAKQPELKPVGKVMSKDAAEKYAIKVQEKLDAKAEPETLE